MARAGARIRLGQNKHRRIIRIKGSLSSSLLCSLLSFVDDRAISLGGPSQHRAELGLSLSLCSCFARRSCSCYSPSFAFILLVFRFALLLSSPLLSVLRSPLSVASPRHGCASSFISTLRSSFSPRFALFPRLARRTPEPRKRERERERELARSRCTLTPSPFFDRTL